MQIMADPADPVLQHAIKVTMRKGSLVVWSSRYPFLPSQSLPLILIDFFLSPPPQKDGSLQLCERLR